MVVFRWFLSNQKHSGVCVLLVVRALTRFGGTGGPPQWVCAYVYSNQKSFKQYSISGRTTLRVSFHRYFFVLIVQVFIFRIDLQLGRKNIVTSHKKTHQYLRIEKALKINNNYLINGYFKHIVVLHAHELL